MDVVQDKNVDGIPEIDMGGLEKGAGKGYGQLSRRNIYFLPKSPWDIEQLTEQSLITIKSSY